jgi:hypothetical protein
MFVGGAGCLAFLGILGAPEPGSCSIKISKFYNKFGRAGRRISGMAIWRVEGDEVYECGGESISVSIVYIFIHKRRRAY